MTQWTTDEAIELCKLVEEFAPAHGFHVALTGGLLYKEGARKDCDIVLYRIRQHEGDWPGFWDAAAKIGFYRDKSYGFCTKAHWRGKPVDVLDPDDFGDQYDCRKTHETAQPEDLALGDPVLKELFA